REAKPSGNLEEISSLLSHSEEKIREQALRLAGNWKLRRFVPQLLAEAGASQSETIRKAAFEALREIGGRQVISELLPLTSKDKKTAIRQQAVLTLAALDLEKASRPAAEILIELTDEKEATEFWRSMLSVKGAGEKVAHALPKTGLPPAMAKAGLRVAREGGRNEPDLVWALTRGADLEGETQSLSAAEIQQLATRVSAEGDAARGEKIFRRKELNCFTCHAIGGVGGKVGPDLTSIGASAQVDYLIESILYPNRKIKEGYHSVIVETKDGLEFSGVLVKENADELVLRDATDKETVIDKNNVQKRSTGNSLMPSGLVDLLTPAERLDLFRFLAELGKPGPFDAAKGNVARSWKLFPQTLEVAQFGDEKVLETKLNDSQWKPARSLVDGRVLKEELAASLEGFERRDPRAVFAAAKFEVAKAGPISLKITGADGAAAWVDGKAAGSCGDLKPELQAGTHFIVVKLEAKKLPDAIRLESPDATFVGSW
ncbi:MAG: hypothetical protein DME25_01130, partial [Verrucomicrobia bacterium]